jgi:hypothetical protein
VTDLPLTDRILREGRTLVRTIDPSGPIERGPAGRRRDCAGVGDGGDTECPRARRGQAGGGQACCTFVWPMAGLWTLANMPGTEVEKE